MKAILIALPVLFVSVSALASDVTCRNQSEYFQEDSLVLNLTTMTGEYFDNDSWIPLVCKKEQYVILCNQKGDQNSLRTQIDRYGRAVAIYSEEQVVDFKCTLPAPLSL